jgi:predicted cupin superfamily sugar epimerase
MNSDLSSVNGSTAEQVIEQLRLVPHPEGGFFAETFRAESLPFELPGRGARNASTAIYFLLRARDFSALHVVQSDEVWHHYLGDPLELHCFDAVDRYRRVLLGSQLTAGERPQHVVRAGELQAARVLPGVYGFALCGCTVAPGFDFADFRMPARTELLARLPAHHELVRALTRQ